MMIRIRRRCAALPTLWVALLALAFVVQPVLLAASEVHESEHLMQSGRSHDAEHAAAGISVMDAVDPDSHEFMHELMHLGHCCGQGSALPIDSLAMPSVMRPAIAAVSPALALRSLILPQLLRPPIRV